MIRASLVRALLAPAALAGALALAGCYGEDGYQGHRFAHPVVWEVPYAEFVLPGGPA